MEAETLTIIGSNGLMLAVVAGVAWNRLSQVEDQLERNNELLLKQNSRIDKLEEWRANRRGYSEGYEQAKDKYEGGPNGPNRKLQG